MRKLLLAFSCALAFLACDNPRAEPDPVPFLKIKVLGAYGFNRWIFATDENGELLDAEPLADGIELATLKEFTSFDLSILYVQKNYLDITTYKNFKESDIVLSNGYSSSQSPSPVGMARINITNFLGSQVYTSDLDFSSSYYGSSPFYSWGNPTYDGSTYGVFKMLAREPETVFVTGIKSGTLVYHIFDNVMDGSVHTADFNTFLPHENQFTIDNTTGYVISVGLSDDDRSTFALVENSHWDPAQPPLVMGTVPGFTRYQTKISANGIFYLKLGGAVSSFTSPEYSAVVLNRTMATFSSTIDIPYEYQYAHWGRNEVNAAFVTVYADKSSTTSVNYEIPPEIISKYPFISLDRVLFSQTTFVHSPGSWSYEDFIAERFKNAKKSEYEYYQLPAQ